MKILQIAIGVSYSSIYKNLFFEFNKNSIDFEVYVPQHNNESVANITKRDFPFKFYSNKIIRSYDKLLYFTKINRMLKDVQKNFNLSNTSLIHAHSLFSDGAVAYEIYKKYKIPYMVAVRDTDVNQYFRKAIHLRKYANKILNNAKYIIFLSKSYRDYVIKKYISKKLQNSIKNKTRIIPNGIEKYWLKNKFERGTIGDDKKIILLYVGQIVKRKNISKIIEAAEVIKRRFNKKVKLTLIGERKDKDYFEMLSNKGNFEYIPYLSKEELIIYYRKSSVFVMPSLTETFGLVYAEAMSQGLPIIYTKGQGFDKQFDEGEVGYSVDPMDPNDIAKKILWIIDDWERLSINCTRNVDKFDWSSIVKEYIELYSLSF